VGFTEGTKNYGVYDLADRKIYISHDVYYNEAEFPLPERSNIRNSSINYLNDLSTNFDEEDDVARTDEDLNKRCVAVEELEQAEFDREEEEDVAVAGDKDSQRDFHNAQSNAGDKADEAEAMPERVVRQSSRKRNTPRRLSYDGNNIVDRPAALNIAAMRVSMGIESVSRPPDVEFWRTGEEIFVEPHSPHVHAFAIESHIRLVDDPGTFKKACRSSNWQSIWEPAFKKEIKGLQHNKVWELVDRPKNAKVIPSTSFWVTRVKYDECGIFLKGKA